MKLLHVLVMAAFLGSACTEDGEDVEEAPATLFDGWQEQPGLRCSVGGVVLSSGLDNNGNGRLDAAEVRDVHVVCNLADRIEKNKSEFLILSRPQPAGGACPAGGMEFQWGIDANNNGNLDAGEVDGSATLCNGSPGAAGAVSLVNTSNEPAGGACAAGGVKVETGVDGNRNGQLDPGEVRSTSFVCHGERGDKGDRGERGEAGADGASALIDSTSEPPGPNCSAGGVKISVGVDANRDGTLSDAEVTRVSYVCGGAPAATDAGVDTAVDDSTGPPLCDTDAAEVCSVTIYDVKERRIPVGTAVRLTGVVVTAVRVTGLFSQHDFFGQVSPDDPGYRGPEDSGIFVVSRSRPSVGDHLDVIGLVREQAGQIRLEEQALSLRAQGTQVPPAIRVSAGEVASGLRAEDLEGALIEVNDVRVESVAGGVFPAFTLEGGLTVDPFVFPALPTVSPGQRFALIRGVLNLRSGTFRLSPRSEVDYTPSP